MARLVLDKLTKRYGDFEATRDVTIDVPQGEFLVLLGPSGCGKTTTLRMIAGFIEPTSGSVHLGDRDITRLPPWKRNTGLVFQSYALFPHLTVNQNVAFPLEMRAVGQVETEQRVAEALKLVRLDHLGDRLPRQLSGGQQQRVALARALVFHPDVLLLDEPLSNLDAKLRQEVRVEIRELQRDIGITTVMVTHDQEEALTMADRLIVMSEGRVRQIGTQRDLYERPANRFVAGFVGRGSFLEGTVTAPGLFRTTAGLDIRCDHGTTGPAVMALRPERVMVQPVNADNSFSARVEFVSYMGGLIDVHARLPAGEQVIAQIANTEDTVTPGVGDEIRLGWSSKAAFVFPAEKAS